MVRPPADSPTVAAAETTDWLRARAGALPDRLAARDGAESLSFAQLDARADAAARRLASLGARAGSRVAVLKRNGVGYVVLVHAIARLGAIMVPISIRLSAAELTWIMNDSAADLLVTERALGHLAAAAIRDRPTVARIDSEDLDRTSEADVTLRRDVEFNAVQGIVYTSATSGRPKGVMLTFGNHWWSATASALHIGLRSDDCWLVLLPLYHVGGLAIVWRSVIYGIPAIVHQSFDAAAVNREIDEGRITITSVVSTMLQRMLDARAGRSYPPSLRCVLVGGGPAPQPLIDASLRLGVPVAPTYGLTEASSQVATMRPGEVARKPGSSGKLLFPTDVRIEDGEVLVRGPIVMLGYAGRPEESARVLRDGWLHTGDLGTLDEEGYLYITDRRDDLILTGGENVYPAEVETVLREHPSIDDAAVVGLRDEVWGETVGAAVTLQPGARLDEPDVTTFCQSRLARFKVPQRLWVVETLPRSSAGKVLRRQVREEAPPSASPAVRRAWVRNAFHAIAGRYDLLNHVLSGGIHVVWKRAAVRAAALRPGESALDICCGTADLLLGMARVVGAGGQAIGVDFAPGMLAGAALRIASTRPRARVSLVGADAEALPLADGTQHAATFAFGLRNVADPARALGEARRVLRSGGRLVVLDFGRPRSRVLRAVYDLYSRLVIPRLGGWLSGRTDAYQYLHDSIRWWTDPPGLAELIRRAGFENVRYRLLSGGIAVLHTAVKGDTLSAR